MYVMLSVAIEEGNNTVWYGRFINLPGTHARAFLGIHYWKNYKRSWSTTLHGWKSTADMLV